MSRPSRAGALTRKHLTRDPCSTASPEGRTPARVARIPTHGDGLIDRDLLVLADQLEEEADVREEYLKPAAMPEDGSPIV